MYSVRVDAQQRRMAQLNLAAADKDAPDNLLGEDATGGDEEPNQDSLDFSVGNPRVEHITGTVHLYRRLPTTDAERVSSSRRKGLPEERGLRLCCLAVPADMTVAGFCTFAGAYLEHIRELRVLRREAVQRVVCMVLVRFDSQESADGFFKDFNGKPFSSLEPEALCRLVFVKDFQIFNPRQEPAAKGPSSGAASASGGGAAAAAAASSTPSTSAPASGGAPPQTESAASHAEPPAGSTELPTCPVCLERLDEHVSGVVTTVCNHNFHSECLRKWGDTSCPVCRYCLQPGASSSRCSTCSTQVDLWICLICGHVGCGRYRSGHASDHWQESAHCYALELETQRVWDYAGDNYVHRLIQSKTDGKLIEVASPGPAGGGGGGGGGSGRTSRSPRDSHGGASCQRRSHCGGHGGGGGECCDPGEEAFQQALIASKIDAVAAEYNHLLCSQLDSQRHYFEGLLAQQAEDAERRLEAAAKAASTSEAAAAEARGAAKEAVSKRQAAERKLADAQAAVAQAAKERDFLRSLSDNLLADKKEWAARLEAAQKDVAQKEAEVRDLKDQVHDLMMFIEAQKSIEALGAEGNELREASLLPVAAPPPQRRGKGKAASAGGSPAGASSGSKK